MSRPSVTVVIPAWNQWEFTRSCLETLRPTLGVHDEVVVVDNGSHDETARALSGFPWAKVITNEENRGFAIACNQGAAIASGDIIVFLNNDTLLAGRWIDALVAPFADTTVAATGPRSNYVAGPQLVEDVPYSLNRMPELRAFEREWRESHRAETTEVDRLIGFCVAVRRAMWEEVGGFDEQFETGGFEDDDLSTRLRAKGWKLLIADASFVHHHGHVTFTGNNLDRLAIQEANAKRFEAKHGYDWTSAFRKTDTPPLLSACLIVKDEEENLPTCLASLDRIVDEVVVYDTGSTDKTVEIARNAGARVIEGFWDDDFSRARNEALAECRGDWILHVDADEVVHAEALELRNMLQRPDVFPSLLVPIENVGDAHVNETVEHRACRLFKRSMHKWSGRLHEQVVLKNGDSRTNTGLAGDIKIVHSGYTAEAMQRRNKIERNLRLAEADVTTGEGDQAFKLLNLARTMVIAGRHEEAFVKYVEASALPTTDVVRRNVLRGAAEALLVLGRAPEALEWLNDLDKVSDRKNIVRFLRGTAYLNLGEAEKATEQFEGLEEIRDDDGLDVGTAMLHIRRGLAFAAARKWPEARAELTLAAQEQVHDAIWLPLLDSFRNDDQPLASYAELIPTEKNTAVYAQILAAPPAVGDEVAELLWDSRPSDAGLLAFIIRLAPRLAVERALEWSVRLRTAGLAQHCPLMAIADDDRATPVNRVRAAAIASAAFSEEEAKASMQRAAARFAERDFVSMLIQLNELAPAMLEPFVIGAATTTRRCLNIARALHELGASEEAVAVCEHGVSSATQNDKAVVDEAEAWLATVRA